MRIRTRSRGDAPRTPSRRARLALLLPLALGPAVGCGRGAGDENCDPARAYPPGVTRGPQVDLPSPTAATICWATTEPRIGTVEWGVDAAYGSHADEPSPVRTHAVRVSGLRPGTAYRYRISNAGEPAGGDHAFRTPPADPAAPVTFGVIGDSGTGCPPALGTIAALAALAPDFVLHTGDAAYSAGTPSQVRTRFTIPFADLRASTALFPALGNHDVRTEDGAPLLETLVLPTNSSDGSSHFYAFDWGPCHVVCLDSNRPLGPGSAQRAWLDADLGASGARWTFVVLHHPVHSASSHGDTPGLAESLGPLFDAHGVDVVFGGHDHDYERTYPTRAGVPADVLAEPDYVDPAGTVYVVTGGGGSDLYAAGASPLTARSEAAHHVVRAEVWGDVLTLTAIRSDGSVLDRSTVTKTP